MTEPRVKLPEPFVDGRGSIQNLFECGDGEMPAGGVAVITSCSGAVRSNHFHRTDWHYLHVLSGNVLYEWRGLEDEKIESCTVHAGETFFTPPMVWHRVTSVTDSVMISVSRLSRKHAVHEADLVRGVSGTRICWFDSSHADWAQVVTEHQPLRKARS